MPWIFIRLFWFFGLSLGFIFGFILSFRTCGIIHSIFIFFSDLRSCLTSFSRPNSVGRPPCSIVHCCTCRWPSTIIAWTAGIFESFSAEHHLSHWLGNRSTVLACSFNWCRKSLSVPCDRNVPPCHRSSFSQQSSVPSPCFYSSCIWQSNIRYFNFSRYWFVVRDGIQHGELEIAGFGLSFRFLMFTLLFHTADLFPFSFGFSSFTFAFVVVATVGGWSAILLVMSSLSAVETNHGQAWARIAAMFSLFSTWLTFSFIFRLAFASMFAFTFGTLSTFLAFTFAKPSNVHVIFTLRLAAKWLNVELHSNSRLKVAGEFGMHVIEVQETTSIKL